MNIFNSLPVYTSYREYCANKDTSSPKEDYVPEDVEIFDVYLYVDPETGEILSHEDRIIKSGFDSLKSAKEYVKEQFSISDSDFDDYYHPQNGYTDEVDFGKKHFNLACGYNEYVFYGYIKPLK